MQKTNMLFDAEFVKIGALTRLTFPVVLTLVPTHHQNQGTFCRTFGVFLGVEKLTRLKMSSVV